MGSCAFCEVRDRTPEQLVLDEPDFVALLDHRPLFHGHVLVCPREHVVTLDELPDRLVAPLFTAVRRVSRALRSPVVGAEGSFVAANTVVSQSVAHLHVHVVPRRRGDGLRGFFWPRTTYDDDGPDDVESWRRRVRAALDEVT